MGIFNKPVTACHGLRSSRAPARALLKRARAGETGAYQDLAAPYFDLLSEHLYLCNLDRPEALRKMEALLREAWKRLPSFKRLSDWEYFLAQSLMAVEVRVSYSRDEERPQTLLDLGRKTKFALIAFDLENWSYRWLSLALRVQPKELAGILFEARCRLLKIAPSGAAKKSGRGLALVSADLDGQLKPSHRRQAMKKLCACDATRSFKSHWLAYRCQLIEMRQQIRFSAEERDSFLAELARNLDFEEMLRPSLLTRLRNMFSFQESLREDVMPRRDFRYGDS